MSETEKTIIAQWFHDALLERKGPLIGILTGRGKEQSVVGNGTLFKSIQREALNRECLSIVFTMEDVSLEDETIRGFVYHPDKDRWFSMNAPQPDVVYNRIPIRKLEEKDSFHTLCENLRAKGIPLINPRFLHKYEVYHLLLQDEQLRHTLPETIMIKDEHSLKTFLLKHNTLYLKRSNGHMGKGLYVLTQYQKDKYKLKDLHNETIFTSFPDLWDTIGQVLLDKSYLAQKAIEPYLFDDKRFDFRILAHSQGDHYEVTGIGIRQSSKEAITTHVPNGGELLSYEHIRTQEHDSFFAEAVQKIGQLLTKEYGLFGEFSIDAALTTDGNYVIFEVNSKPMLFDEQWIELERTKKLISLFHTMANWGTR